MKAEPARLIVHADDLGMCHSINAAAIAAFDRGTLTSASCMVPCPAFTAIADYGRSNPDLDLGIHLTLTSEWPDHRWRPIAAPSEVPSLLGTDGYLHATPSTLRAVSPTETMREMEAQVGAALEAGLSPTHLDVHMYATYYSESLFTAYLDVARSSGLPAVVVEEVFDWHRLPRRLLEGRDAAVVRSIRIRGDMTVDPDDWFEHYLTQVDAVRTGTWQIVLHPGVHDDELEAVTGRVTPFGAAWRQRDLDFLMSPGLRDRLPAGILTGPDWRRNRATRR